MSKRTRGTESSIEDRLKTLVEEPEYRIVAIGLDDRDFEEARKEQIIKHILGCWRYRDLPVVRTETMTVISRF